MGQSRLLRHSENRKRRLEGTPPWLSRFRVLLCWPVVVGMAFWAAATCVVLSGLDRMPYALNEHLRQPVLARVDFQLEDGAATEKLRLEAQQKVADHYRLNEALVGSIQGQVRELYEAVKAAESFEKYDQDPKKPAPLSAAAFDSLKAIDRGAGGRLEADLKRLAELLGAQSMVERAEVERSVRSTCPHVILLRGGRSDLVTKERLTYAANSEHVDHLAERVVRDLPFHGDVRRIVADLVRRSIAPGESRPPQPIYVYDEVTTREKLEAAQAIPPVMKPYRRGEILAKAGPLDGGGLKLLGAEHVEYNRQRRTDPALRAQWRKERLGLTGIILVIVAGLGLYSYRCQPKAVIRTPRCVALAVLLLLMLLADRYVLISISSSPIWSVATITMAAAILTITYNQLFAVGATTGLALLTTLMFNAGTGTLIIYLSVSAVTILLLREIRTRLKMVEVGGITALAAVASTFLVGLSQQQELRHMTREAAFGALAALAGTSIVLVLLPIIEKAFRITTNLTLLEWADTSRPLLRQLIETAPGTWQHSHLLGSMAEAAAEEIGANGLLVRVGAYYHDIGKMCKPNYFVENQSTKASAHRGLAPTMSLLVILAHVKDGLALAREHRLPTVLHQFIAEHHGTTVVRYFHAMAAQEARASGRGDREVSDTEFRYPGPKPRTPESAILMLCDGVEGTVRSLQDPTPSRIEGVVHDIVMDRLMDGQFDACDITLQDIARVEQSLVRSLCSIYHGRISYPTLAEEPAAQVRSA